MEHPTWEELTDYFDKNLPLERHSEVEAHIATCDACSEQIEWLYKTTGLLKADVFALPPRRVRVAAESLFELRHVPVAPTAADGASRLPIGSPVKPGTTYTPPLQPLPSSAPREGVSRPIVSYGRRFAWVGGAVVALLIIMVFAIQPPQGPLVAAVQSQEGQVDIVRPQNSFTLPFGATTFSEGNSITTGVDGAAQLLFANGAVRVVMLDNSNLVYVRGQENEGIVSEVALATDSSGDIELEAQEGVKIHLQTGIGLMQSTGGHFRVHYLEPRIVAVRVLRGVVTVTSPEHGSYNLEMSDEEVILDYTQATMPTATSVPATEVPATPTLLPSPSPTMPLPTRLPPSPTSSESIVPSDDNAPVEAEHSETETEGDDHAAGELNSSTPALPTTITAPAAPAPVETESGGSTPSDSGSGSGDHDDNSGSGLGGGDHDDNSGSGSGDHDDNSGSGSGGGDHDDNSGSGSGGGDHDSP